jgi:hypothetical protein
MRKLHQDVKDSLEITRSRRRLGASCCIAASLLALSIEPAAADGRMDVGDGAGYYIALGFEGQSSVGGAQHLQEVREALAKELQKMPDVKLAGNDRPKRVHAKLSRRSFFVDGSIQRLSTSRAGGRQQIDCELRAFVATWPERAIKVMVNQGAAVETGSEPAQEATGQRECLLAAADAVREAIEGYLHTVK